MIQLNPSVPNECLSQSISSFWTKWEAIRFENPFKTVEMIRGVCEIVPASKIQEYAEQLNGECCSLVYEAEDYRQYHRKYLDNFKVINVDESKAFRMTDSYVEYVQDFQDIQPESVTVESILDTMISQVDSLCEPRRPSPSPATSNTDLLSTMTAAAPWLCQIKGKVLFEYNDTLMAQVFLANDISATRTLYRRTFESSKFFNKLTDMFETIPEEAKDLVLHPVAKESAGIGFFEFELQLNYLFVTNVVEKPDEVKLTTEKGSELEKTCDYIMKAVEKRTKKPEYYADHMTPEALQQQLAQCFQTFDRHSCEYIPVTDSVLFRFWNEDVRFHTECSEHVLPTYLCLRDFVEYVLAEQIEWFTSDGTDTNTSRWSQNELSSTKLLTLRTGILPSEFYRNRSLKKHGNIQFEDDFTPPVKRAADPPIPSVEPIEEQEPKPKGKAKKAKKGKAIPTPSDPAVQELNIEPKFFGYNLDDRRYQLNVRRSVYQSDISTIRYELHEWLYRQKHLYIDVETFGQHIYCNKTFYNNGEPIDDVRTVMVRSPNGILLTVNRAEEPFEQKQAYGINDLSATNRLRFGLSWPLGLHISTGTTEIDKMDAVEQCWVEQPRHNEVHRRFHANGIVEILKENGDEVVYTSTGTIYETITDDDFELIKMTGESLTMDENQEQSLALYKVHSDAIEFLSALNPVFFERLVKLTTADGHRFIIENGSIVRNDFFFHKLVFKFIQI